MSFALSEICTVGAQNVRTENCKWHGLETLSICTVLRRRKLTIRDFATCSVSFVQTVKNITLYLDSLVLRAKLRECVFWNLRRRGWRARSLAGLPVRVQAPVEGSVDGSLLLCTPGPHWDLAGDDGTQVYLLLSLPHLGKDQGSVYLCERHILPLQNLFASFNSGFIFAPFAFIFIRLGSISLFFLFGNWWSFYNDGLIGATVHLCSIESFPDSPTTLRADAEAGTLAAICP